MEESLGTVTVAPEVLIQLVQLTTLATPGVACLSPHHPNGVQRLFNGKVGEGVRIELADDAVSADVYIVAEPDAQMLVLGHKLQDEIGHAIQDVVGMTVHEINVFIQDVADRSAKSVAQN